MVFLGFQGIYAKIKIFMAPSKDKKRSEAVTSWVASHRLAMGEKKRYRQQKRVRTFRKIT